LFRVGERPERSEESCSTEITLLWQIGHSFQKSAATPSKQIVLRSPGLYRKAELGAGQEAEGFVETKIAVALWISVLAISTAAAGKVFD
jgi:hypothetical protein